MVAELRRIAAQSSAPLHATDLPTGLQFAVQRYFGSIGDAREAAGLPAPDLKRRWSKETLVTEIQRLHRTGVRITDLALEKEHGDVLGAIRMYFSGVPAARRAAKVQEPAPISGKRTRWDEARVVAEIEELDRSGESIAASRVPNPLLKAGKRYFGSWAKTLEAAGFDPAEIQLRRNAYTEEELVELLRMLAKNVPEMRLSELYEHAFYPALVRLFGNVDAALERADLRDWPVRERLTAMSRDDVVAAIRQRDHQGQATNRAVVAEDDYHLWYSGMVHFGEWRLAAEAAGVDMSDHNERWTDERLLDALRSRSREGRSMRPSDLMREDEKLYRSVIGHFGSYRAGCRAAGIHWSV